MERNTPVNLDASRRPERLSPRGLAEYFLKNCFPLLRFGFGADIVTLTVGAGVQNGGGGLLKNGGGTEIGANALAGKISGCSIGRTVDGGWYDVGDGTPVGWKQILELNRWVVCLKWFSIPSSFRNTLCTCFFYLNYARPVKTLAVKRVDSNVIREHA